MPTEKEMFERLLREELLPLFPQSDLSPDEPKHSHKRASYSASHARTAIRLQLSISSDHAFLIHRSQGFDEMEKMIMSAFVEQALPMPFDDPAAIESLSTFHQTGQVAGGPCAVVADSACDVSQQCLGS